MRKVLVTGASGFIGEAFVRSLNSVADSIGYQVIPMVRKPTGMPREIVLDFNDQDFCSKVRRMQSVYAVVHLGAKVDFGDPLDELFATNVVATDILANWAKESGAYFMFASSIMVYGAKTSEIKKCTKINLDTAYARSKWMAEKVIEASGVEHLILRFAGVYGNNGSPSLGINRAILQAQNGETPIQYGDGKGRRNYIYVVDLVKLLIFMLKTRPKGIHLIAGTEVIRIADMLKGVCATFLLRGTPIYQDGMQGYDQIVECSDEYRWTQRKFGDALQHMKLWHERGRS